MRPVRIAIRNIHERLIQRDTQVLIQQIALVEFRRVSTNWLRTRNSNVPDLRDDDFLSIDDLTHDPGPQSRGRIFEFLERKRL